MKISFRALVKICIISVYIIILAGATVRMTGSGMGCPDWPKCFGYLIPPTSEAQLRWKSDHDYSKQIVIIKEDQLLVAKRKFRSGEKFSNANWSPYTKHDYATFNATHTWVEYINRLTSAIAGIFFVLLLIRSWKYWKVKKSIPIFAIAAFAMLLFEAWLGKTVVDSNLAVSKISIHMMVALAIVAVLLIILFQLRNELKTNSANNVFKWLVFAGLGLTIVQVILGIEVRQLVDVSLKNIGLDQKSLLDLSQVNNFIIHRSFSILVVLVNIGVYYQMLKNKLNYRIPKWVLIVLGIEVISGIVMYYVNFPFGSQAIHLLFATILFGLQFYLLLKCAGKSKNLSQV